MKTIRVTYDQWKVKFYIVEDGQIDLIKETPYLPNVDYLVVARQYARVHKADNVERK